MGQKVHPIGFRLGFNKGWKSNWYSERNYGDYLIEDIKIRDIIKNKFKNGSIEEIFIERPGEKIIIKIATGRPAVVIGKQGKEIETMTKKLEKLTSKEVRINIQKIENPSISAKLVSQNIALQLSKRAPFRRALNRALKMIMSRESNVEGAKILISGRLGGAEMARKEWVKEGRIPLHTLRADIDYAFTESYTAYGKIGVKVWIYKGDKVVIKHRRENKKETPKDVNTR